MFKRLSVLFLTVAAILLLTACVNQQSSPVPDSSEISSTPAGKINDISQIISKDDIERITGNVYGSNQISWYTIEFYKNNDNGGKNTITVVLEYPESSDVLKDMYAFNISQGTASVIDWGGVEVYFTPASHSLAFVSNYYYIHITYNIEGEEDARSNDNVKNIGLSIKDKIEKILH